VTEAFFDLLPQCVDPGDQGSEFPRVDFVL
jgi:hypothetical protein